MNKNYSITTPDYKKEEGLSGSPFVKCQVLRVAMEDDSCLLLTADLSFSFGSSLRVTDEVHSFYQ